MNRLCFFIVISLLLLNPYIGFAQTGVPQPTNVDIKRSRIRILTIGIGLYEKSLDLKHLNSAHDLSSYDKDSMAYKYIWPSYNSHPDVISRNGRMGVKEVEDVLYNFAGDTNGQDVVIIHILGHGDFDEKTGEYYLVCSNGEKIAGEYIRNQIYCMTDKGALVIVFLDTCHAGALFVGKEPKDDRLKGAIAFYPSSKPEQSSHEIERKTLFSQTIFNTFSHKNELAFDIGTSPKYMSLGGIEKVLKSVFNGKSDQTSEPMYFAKKGKLDNCNIKYYPIINQEKINIWGSPRRKVPFYLGPSFGTNFKTPYANLNLGVDINNQHKIEVGFTHSLTKSDEVYIYDNNGIMQNALQYKAMSIYARYGFNWLSLRKNKSRSELVTLAGFSGNLVKGDNTSGFNSNVGESAGSFMGNVCCRWTLDFSKDNKRNVLFNVTAGVDFPIKKDENINNALKDEKYIKNWCTFRPYVEAGFIFNIFKF